MLSKLSVALGLLLGFASTVTLTGCGPWDGDVWGEFPSPDEKYLLTVEHYPVDTLLSDDGYAYTLTEIGKPWTRTVLFNESDAGWEIKWLDNKQFALKWPHKDPYNAHAERYCRVDNLIHCSSTPYPITPAPKVAMMTNMASGAKLAFAAQQGDIDAVKMLLQQGVDINHRTPYGNTAVIKAAEAGQADIVSLLLKHGADISAKNSRDITALSSAITENQVEIVKTLLQAGAKQKDSDLAIAVSKNETEIVEILLKNGANPNALRDDTPVLIDAAVTGQTEIAALLPKHGADVNIRDTKSNGTPLVYAALWGREEVVKLLLEKGADVNIKGHSGSTALSEAMNGVGIIKTTINEKIVQLLLKHGAEVNAHGNGDSPLANAVNHGDLKLIKILLKSGADPNDTNKYGDSPLMNAVSAHRPELVKFLLAQGADLNHRSDFGENALRLAAREREPELCEILIKAGAKPNEVYKHSAGTVLDGVTRSSVRDMDRSHSWAREATFQILRKYGAKTSEELGIANQTQ